MTFTLRVWSPIAAMTADGPLGSTCTSKYYHAQRECSCVHRRARRVNPPVCLLCAPGSVSPAAKGLAAFVHHQASKDLIKRRRDEGDTCRRTCWIFGMTPLFPASLLIRELSAPSEFISARVLSRNGRIWLYLAAVACFFAASYVAQFARSASSSRALTGKPS
jgi:hypothetical protein